MVAKSIEILHHLTDAWKPINNGMFTTYQLVQDFATIHRITCLCCQNGLEFPVRWIAMTRKLVTYVYKFSLLAKSCQILMFDILIQGFLVFLTISLFVKFSLRQPKIQVVETVKNAHLGPPFTIAKLVPLTPISLCFVGDISIIYIYIYYSWGEHKPTFVNDHWYIWKIPTFIWRFPEVGVPLVIIHL